MSEHVYRHIELTGSSTTSADAAIHNAIGKAGQTVRHMDWFEVTGTRGVIQEGRIACWQVTLKVGFRVED